MIAIRNIGIMAHIDAGKTTTTERILFYTGVTHRWARSHDGTAVMDWMEQEQERGITITAAATTCSGATTGQPDRHPGPRRLHRSRSSARCGSSTASSPCSARSAGVEPQSETVWRQADRYRVPRIAFINKCDRSAPTPHGGRRDARPPRRHPIAIQLPIGAGATTFDGVVDLVHQRIAPSGTTRAWGRFTDVAEIPAELLAEVPAAREAMFEALAEVDDEFMDAVPRADEPARRAEVKRRPAPGHPGRRSGPGPVGAALTNKGVQLLLDAVVDYLPSPVGHPASRRRRSPAPTSESTRPAATTRRAPPWRSRS